MTQKDLNRMMGKPHALLDNVATPGEGEYSIVFNRVDENDEYKNEATGKSAFACGCNTEASGDYSFAANDTTLAQHDASATFGQATKTGRNGQFVCGKYNTVSDHSFLVVGYGTSDAERRNVLEAWDEGFIRVARGIMCGAGNGSLGRTDQTVLGKFANIIAQAFLIIGDGTNSEARRNLLTLMQRDGESNPAPGNLLLGDNTEGAFPPVQYNSLTRKDYVDAKFYTFELNDTTYDFSTGTLTETAAAALLAAITAKKPIFYIGLCAGTTNIFDPSLNDPICGFVNYNPVPGVDGKYYINIPDNIMLSEQQYGATFDPATGAFYPNGV